jgi:thioredoxin reductase
MAEKLYDILILGGEPAGLDLAQALSDSGLEVAIISSNFNYRTKAHEFANITVMEDPVVFLTYYHGLLALTLKNNAVILGRNLILATGTKPTKLSLKNQNILYKTADIKEKRKNEQAVVSGNGNQAITFALDLAKKFRYVYLCSQDYEPQGSKSLLRKLSETPNIVHLPGCSVSQCKNDRNGMLAEVCLDTYESIKTNTFVASTPRTPDLPAFTKKFVEVLDSGHADVTQNFESKLVPGVFFIGSLVPKMSKKQLLDFAEFLKEKCKKG